MKKNTYRYICLVSTLIISVLILMKWFTISAVGTVETHSFMTIPAMLCAGAGFLTQIGGKSVAVTVLILSGILEYMCIVASSLGIWGAWRSFKNNNISTLVFASQIISGSLALIAVITICIINFVSQAMLGDIISVVPTLWLIIAIIFIVASVITSLMYSKNKEQSVIEQS